MAPSRASVALGDLPGWGQAGDAERVLATFVGERMITVDADAAQITHDALLTAWPRLRAWIEEDTGQLRDRGRILEGAQAWARPAGRRTRCGAAAGWRWRGSGRPMPASGRRCPARRSRSWTRAWRRPTPASERPGGAPAGCSPPSPCSPRWCSPWPGFPATPSASGRRRVPPRTRRYGAGMANSRDVAFTADQLRSDDPAAAAQLSVSADEFARTPQATASLLESSGAPRWRGSTTRPGSCSGSPSARAGGCWRRQATTGRCGCGTWRCPGGRC